MSGPCPMCKGSHNLSKCPRWLMATEAIAFLGWITFIGIGVVAHYFVALLAQ